MKLRAAALLLVSVLISASACASGQPVSSTTPSKNGAYAWHPIAGAPALVCSLRLPFAVRNLVDYRGRPYFCKLPKPADRHGRGGIDFFGPTTAAAGAVPLGPRQQRIYMNVFATRPAVLRVDFGDGAHWERAVPANPNGERFDVVHSYAATTHAFILVTLRDKTGYLALAGEGPFRAPLAGPRTRFCAYESDGKGGTLTATPALSCAKAGRLYSGYNRTPYRVHSTYRGYECRASGLPPWGSDVGAVSCTRGSRAFIFTSVP